MSRELEEVLAVWRDGERLLEELPPFASDHETVRLAVAALAGLYQSMTQASGASHEAVRSSSSTLERARAAIRATRERMAPSGYAGSVDRQSAI